MIKKIALTTISIAIISFAEGQKQRDDHDSSYYKTYRSELTMRIFLSRKYTVISYIPPSPAADFQYRANTSLDLGMAATYHAFTLGISFGVEKFNPDEVKGNTKYLDLQGHFYNRRWNIDLLGEFYKGYYLTPKGKAAMPGEEYYKRQDIGLSLVGLAFYRCLNEREFSYQAGLVHNEWQKKSAGSFLLGGEIYYGAIYGDSTLIPTVLDRSAASLVINKSHFFIFGPGIGYAYTLVIKEHFFMLGSANLGLAFRYSQEISSSRDLYYKRFGFNPNLIVHAGIGYNSDKWCMSFLWVDATILSRGERTDYYYKTNAGNYRIVYARRFALGKKTKKILEPIPQILGQ